MSDEFDSGEFELGELLGKGMSGEVRRGRRRSSLDERESYAIGGRDLESFRSSDEIKFFREVKRRNWDWKSTRLLVPVELIEDIQREEIQVVMPEISGGTVGELVERNLSEPKDLMTSAAVLSLEQFEGLVADISIALSRMEEMGFAHSDIKSWNILAERVNNRLGFYLADFNLVEEVGRDDTRDREAWRGELVGWMLYRLVQFDQMEIDVGDEEFVEMNDALNGFPRGWENESGLVKRVLENVYGNEVVEVLGRLMDTEESLVNLGHELVDAVRKRAEG